jgi:nucleoside-diphosphate-sugar epimerase
MKILITGNLGYVGPVVRDHLLKKFKKAEITGYDIGFFKKNFIYAQKRNKNFIQKYGDIRNIKASFVKKFDTVIHLAGISNDPIGNKFTKITNEINLTASIRLFKLCKNHSIKNFIFASSCSIYGAGGKNNKNESDSIKPLTAYAKSKSNFEKEIKKIKAPQMKITSLRFATACGASPNLRIDLVLNDFVFSAIKLKSLKILSDGTPWRPIIHVKDMARAIEWAIIRKKYIKKEPLFINIGSNKNNFQIKKIIKKILKVFKKINISYEIKQKNDKRSYKVDFSLFEKIAPKHQPLFNLDKSIIDLKTTIKKIQIINNQKDIEKLIRLKTLEKLIKNKQISSRFVWI